MVVTGRHWAVVLLLCGASVAAPVAAQQDATEAPTGFDTPTLVDKPGSRSRCVAYRNVSTYPGLRARFIGLLNVSRTTFVKLARTSQEPI
jgi:hypothetical protein